MKQVIIILSLVIFTSISCKKDSQKSELDIITSGKWYMEYMVISGQKTMLPEDEREMNWMIFHKDGRHEIMSFGDPFSGTWEYLKNETSIRMLQEDSYIDQKIEKITNNQLILSYMVNGELEKIGLTK